MGSLQTFLQLTAHVLEASPKELAGELQEMQSQSTINQVSRFLSCGTVNITITTTTTTT